MGQHKATIGASLRQHRANIGQDVGYMGRHKGYMGQHKAKIGASLRQHRANIGQDVGYMGRHKAKIGTTYAKIGPTSAKMCATWVDLTPRCGLDGAT